MEVQWHSRTKKYRKTPLSCPSGFGIGSDLPPTREVIQVTVVAHYGTKAESQSFEKLYEKSWCPREDSNLHSLARTSS